MYCILIFIRCRTETLQEKPRENSLCKLNNILGTIHLYNNL